MQKIKERSLYLVITEEYCKGRGALDIAASAMDGGVDIIQLREKNKPRNEIIRIGKELSGLCRDNGVIFIVNDDPFLAAEVSADGVHLGQEDMNKYPIKETRLILGDGKIIGVSTHSIGQFKLANEEDFDYIAFGPIFETKTKDYFLGLKDVAEVAALARKPVFFIGGINLSNIGAILGKGAKNVALIRGITEATDIAVATKKFKNKLSETVGQV